MNLLELFTRRSQKPDVTAEDMQIIRARVSRSQEAVYKALCQQARPINGLALARYMNVDSASVTPRLAELVRKGKARVAYTKKGLDRMTRKFYVAVENDN